MTSESRNARRLLIVVGAIFFAGGMNAGALGPVLQGLARQTGTDVAAVSTIFSALFISGFVGQSFGAAVGKQMGLLRMLLLGLVLAIAGLCGVVLSQSWGALISAGVVNGLGFGLLFLTGNILASEVSDRAGPINLVNAMFGVGAIIGPGLVWIALRTLDVGTPALWGGPIVLTAAAVLLAFWRPRQPSQGPSADADRRPPDYRGVISSPLIWILGTFCLFQVATELGMSSFLATILQRALYFEPTGAAQTMSLFWLIFTLSRLTAAWASRSFDPPGILIVAVGLSFAGTLVLLAGILSLNAILSLAGIVIAAAGLGPIFPTGLATVRHVYGRDATFATGIVFGMTNIGGALTPLILAAALTRGGPLADAIAYAVFAAGLVVMLAVFLPALRARQTALSAKAQE